MTMSMFLHLYRAPVWRCALTTIVAVPLSYLGVLSVATLNKGAPNPAAAAAYFFMCIVLARCLGD
jgi:hypothetical protein